MVSSYNLITKIKRRDIMQNREETSFVSNFLGNVREVSLTNLSLSIKAAKLCNEKELKLLLPYIDALVYIQESTYEDYNSFGFLCEAYNPELYDTLYIQTWRKSCLDDYMYL